MALTYDATGAGYTTAGTSFSFVHTATAGAYALLGISVDRQETLSLIEFGGTAMTLLGSKGHNNNDASFGSTYLYGLPNVPGSAQNVTGTFSGINNFVANSVSYLNVFSVGGASTASGASTSPSSGAVADLTAGGLTVCVLGSGSLSAAAISAPTGGTNRYIANDSGSGDTGLAIFDATGTSNTFGATLAVSQDWSTVSVNLAPPLFKLVTMVPQLMRVSF